MGVLLIVGFLGGLACAITAAPAGLAVSILTAPIGASISVAIVACLRNLDMDAPASLPRIDFGHMPPRVD